MAWKEDGSDLVNRLISGYALEAEVYQGLLAIAREQGAILESGEDLDGCIALFARKDELLRSIMDVEAEIEPFKRRWWSEDLGLENRERLNGLLDCILATIDTLIKQEQRNEQLLLGHQSQTQAELDHIQRGTELHRTQRGPEPLPRFMDVRR
jgi:hypothetical protein